MIVGICDDEEAVQEDLREKVLQSIPNAEIACFSSGEELLGSGADFDILFLDIQMPGRNGMEIAREFRKIHEGCILIFVTGAEEYVFQAFDVWAFHYLVKPFSREKFAQVLERAVRARREQQGEDNRSILSLHAPQRRLRRLCRFFAWLGQLQGAHGALFWRAFPQSSPAVCRFARLWGQQQ